MKAPAFQPWNDHLRPARILGCSSRKFASSGLSRSLWLQSCYRSVNEQVPASKNVFKSSEANSGRRSLRSGIPATTEFRILNLGRCKNLAGLLGLAAKVPGGCELPARFRGQSKTTWARGKRAIAVFCKIEPSGCGRPRALAPASSGDPHPQPRALSWPSRGPSPGATPPR